MNHFFKNHRRLTSTFNIFGSSNLSKRSRALFSSFASDLLEPDSWKSMEGLVRCKANYVPLSPISFLERSATVYRERTSVVYGSLKFTWAETHQRCLKLASALSQLGISRGDVLYHTCGNQRNGEKGDVTSNLVSLRCSVLRCSSIILLLVNLFISKVAVLAPNVPAMYELHFAVPMAGAVFCTLNTRHDSNMVNKTTYGGFDLLNLMALLPLAPVQAVYEYESLLANGHSGFEIRQPESEWDPISVNYTSGTTSSPKGVVYSHRGAYLNTLATLFLHGIGTMPVYLWTVPMFHCNGWCLTWGMAAQGGTNVCLRKVTPKDIFDRIDQHKVTHMAGAPTVLSMIVNSEVRDRKILPHKVEIMTGGAPPPPQIFFKMEELGFGVSQLYGLTETYGPGTYCSWKPEWDSLPLDERLKMKARQGGAASWIGRC
ncbi:ACYL-ACTIVATING ENZYME [Salix purpurea]|uniref:ACYL-ACTIVATING ENZYME n=1 Tax=Salix purpurea TaxID=77065 RepID=A0A9Q0WWG5_SALPP|nr:ACYL-ACTIVATING ENZYME [Salix purpurea]